MLTHNPTTSRRKAAKLLLGLALLLASQAEAAWTVAMQRDPLTRQTRCLLSSTPQIVSDGYDTTPVTLVFNGDSLLVITESEIDPSFGDLQLAVDENPPIRTDKLDHDMTLVFDREVPELIQQFRKGGEVTAYLRFWPTWPVTQLFPVKFSLIGFSKAHDSMNNNCQPPASATSAQRAG